MPARVFSEEEKQELKISMLENGLPLLKKYGMTHMTVPRITESAGIAVGTFYSFFDSKEGYINELIAYNRQKKLKALVSEDVLTGKKKLGRADAERYLWMMLDREQSVYAYLTIENEIALAKKTSAPAPDLEHETAVGRKLVSYLENTRENIDFALLANMMKLFVIASESRGMLHESGMDATLKLLADTILDIIFKE